MKEGFCTKDDSSTNGFNTLGVPFGSEEFIASRLQLILRQHSNLLEAIPDLENTQIAALLLRLCANARINYWNRMLDPYFVAKIKFLELHDQSISATFDATFHLLSNSTPSLENQLHLPLVKGGMGLTKSVLF
jgi:hypothetical protein